MQTKRFTLDLSQSSREVAHLNEYFTHSTNKAHSKHNYLSTCKKILINKEQKEIKKIDSELRGKLLLVKRLERLFQEQNNVNLDLQSQVNSILLSKLI